nr:uncharacterized protein LOC105844599 [Hydra vulgaris]
MKSLALMSLIFMVSASFDSDIDSSDIFEDKSHAICKYGETQCGESCRNMKIEICCNGIPKPYLYYGRCGLKGCINWQKEICCDGVARPKKEYEICGEKCIKLKYYYCLQGKVYEKVEDQQ